MVYSVGVDGLYPMTYLSIGGTRSSTNQLDGVFVNNHPVSAD